MYPHHSQTMDQVVMAILFIEFLDLQFHIDPMIDSVYITGTCCLDSMYITGTCRFHLYFVFHRDFVVPLSHPLFDPAAPFIAILLYMAHLIPPPAATPP